MAIDRYKITSSISAAILLAVAHPRFFVVAAHVAFEQHAVRLVRRPVRDLARAAAVAHAAAPLAAELGAGVPAVLGLVLDALAALWRSGPS